MLHKLLGTASSPEDTHPRRRADDLADVVLPDHTGKDVRIGDLWAQRPVTLVWLRHYG
jgi:hypothetical protein